MRARAWAARSAERGDAYRVNLATGLPSRVITISDSILSARSASIYEVRMEFSVAALTVETFIGALGLSARFGLALWDSTIIAAAPGLNCAKPY